MELVHMDLLSDGPRLGLKTGASVQLIKGTASLAQFWESLGAEASQLGLPQAVQARLAKRRTSFDELQLDGRLRPPLWLDDPQALSVWQYPEEATSVWQPAGDGRRICRPGAPMLLGAEASQLCPGIAWVLYATGAQVHCLGWALALEQRDRGQHDSRLPFSFGPSLVLTQDGAPPSIRAARLDATGQSLEEVSFWGQVPQPPSPLSPGWHLVLQRGPALECSRFKALERVVVWGPATPLQTPIQRKEAGHAAPN